ncbi:hypothetical protein IL306_004074 [Fusarium sp. DS 682]|nr:hypothetical protein IL306_004074 [Fusarium sp. DS 682]
MIFKAPFMSGLRKHRSTVRLPGFEGRKPRTKMENYNNSGGDEMEWELPQVPIDTAQILLQHHSELQADWDRGLNSIINRVNAQHQHCLQTYRDDIKQIIRMAIEEYVAGTQTEVYSLPSRQSFPEPSNAQLLLESAESNYKAQIEDLTEKWQRTEAELENVKRQLKESELRADQLRNIIIPREEEPILDSKIQELFSEVRKETQWVADRLYSKMDGYRNPTTIESSAFFEKIQSLPPDLRQDAIHSYLFILIRQRFFSTNLRGCEMGAKYQDLQQLLAAGEQDLMKAVAAHNPEGTVRHTECRKHVL